MANKIEQSQRDFLWSGDGSAKKFHLVDWVSVCKPTANGGLGFRPIKMINQALLDKWLWRFGNSSEGLWCIQEWLGYKETEL